MNEFCYALPHLMRATSCLTSSALYQSLCYWCHISQFIFHFALLSPYIAPSLCHSRNKNNFSTNPYNHSLLATTGLLPRNMLTVSDLSGLMILCFSLSFIHSFTHSLTHSFIHSFILSFFLSFIHSFFVGLFVCFLFSFFLRSSYLCFFLSCFISFFFFCCVMRYTKLASFERTLT